VTVDSIPSSGRRRAAGRGPRALRGLIGVFLLSLLNLIGAFFALMAIGGIAPWTQWQFIGIFGFMEIATALALLIAPNVWRLPVQETTQRVVLCPGALFIPRWGALAKLAAGLLLLGVASTQTGVGAGVVLLPFVALAIALLMVALSLAAARLGVARPDLDVCQVVIKRPNRPELALPGVSLSSLVVQFLLNITIVPLVKVAPPTILYNPALGPSITVAVFALLGSALAAGVAAFAWRDRMAWRAPLGVEVDAEPDVA
jgi:hypothetical protein